MHVFFDTVWKLHIGEIPEKPRLCDSYIGPCVKWTGGCSCEALSKEYNEAIAAIKQNALTVGNPEMIEDVFPDTQWPVADKFYKWPGGADILENIPPVAILTLPEEKILKPMKNFAKIIELESHQVVVMKDFDDEEDSDILWIVTHLDGVLAQVKAGFKSEKKRDAAFESYGAKEAQQFVDSMIEMTS